MNRRVYRLGGIFAERVYYAAGCRRAPTPTERKVYFSIKDLLWFAARWGRRALQRKDGLCENMRDVEVALAARR